MNPQRISRRSFLRQGISLSAAGLAVPTILPARVLGAPSANDRIGVAFLGVGRRGQQLLSELPKTARVLAVCDVDRTRAAAAAAKAHCPFHLDYRKVFDLKEVEAVVVATPDHWHALGCIHACQAGKDVYCEKPLTLTIREGRLIVQAARKYQRVVQVGTQRRSFPAHRLGVELIRRGAIGKVLSVLSRNYPSPWECGFAGQPVPEGLNWDMWCGPTQPVPFHQELFIQRARPGWLSFRPYCGGEMTNTGAHGLDLIQWALGADDTGPTEIWAEGGKLEPLVYTVPESAARGNAHSSKGRQVTLRFPGGVTVKLGSDGPLGGAYLGEKGKFFIESSSIRSDPPDLAREALQQAKDVRQGSHLQNWIDCIKSRQRPASDVEIGHRSATICHLGNIARWVGRKLRWDPVQEVFVGDSEANGYLDRPRRSPYQLPDSV
jgi:predicted dehydrogenase